jgi:hypothetical protein
MTVVGTRRPSGTGRLIRSGLHESVRRVPGMSALQGETAIVRALHAAILLFERRREDLTRWDQTTQQSFMAWFGTDSEEARKIIAARIERGLRSLKHLKLEDFIPIPKPRRAGKSPAAYNSAMAEWGSLYAYVNPGYTRRRPGAPAIEVALIHVGPEFATADDTTRAGTIVHELSHFLSVGNTNDVSATFLGDPRKPGEREMYGYTKAERLSYQNSKKALKNADNFEFFIENHDPADHDLDLDGAGDFELNPRIPNQG